MEGGCGARPPSGQRFPWRIARSRTRNELGLLPEQPGDDGAEELARRAASVIEGRWHR
jgi:hypothetical protein